MSKEASGGLAAAARREAMLTPMALRAADKTTTVRPTVTSQETLFQEPSNNSFALSCLKYTQNGCYMVRDKDTCLRSRDGRTSITMGGSNIHGQPCVWCGGQSCTKNGGTVCEPYNWIVKDPGFDLDKARSSFEVASCPELEDTKVPSLFCFALMLPLGYEPTLLKAQLERGVGIFECDEFVVFSNETFVLSKWGSEEKVLTMPIPGSLAVKYGGKWDTALNTDIFIRVWNAVSLLGRYEFHDWTVKVDPDAVFFPNRLRELLLHSPMNSVMEIGGGSLRHSMRASCGNCRLKNFENVTCASRIQSLQQLGESCEVARTKAAVEPPADCGCTCGDLACNVSVSAMYLNNCKFGLHGPIEVISREAVATFLASIHRCEYIRREPFGEDKYLRRCLDLLGVRKVNTFSLLSEIACGQQPVVCSAPNVAFHPFKDEGAYFNCWHEAQLHGQWP
jgi:hypothetical protein